MAKRRDRKSGKERATGAQAHGDARESCDDACESHDDACESHNDDDDDARQPSPRRRLLYLSIPYLIFALMLLVVEAGVRLALPAVTPLQSLVEAQGTQSNFTDREHVTIFEGDPLLFWRVKPNLDHVIWDFTLVSTNAQGLRHDGDIGRKRPGALRVVCVGDSVTFGYRVPVVWPDHPQSYNADWMPYPQLLEKALRAANPGREIEVIALAAPGYTSYQGLEWLRREIDWLEPDVVTACFGWNDVGLRAQTDRELMPADWSHVAYRRLVSHVQTLAHLTRWMQRRRAHDEPPRPATIPRVPADEFAANMLEIARLAEAHGARAVLIGTVYRDAVTNAPEAARVKETRDALRAAANSHGVPYLDIPELTESNYPATQALFGELIHPNNVGHRVMANALLKFFAAYNTLKGLNVPPSI